jgi:hypothetical protein
MRKRHLRIAVFIVLLSVCPSLYAQPHPLAPTYVGILFQSQSRDFWDNTLILIQIITLIALVVYVIKTWHIASATERAAGVTEQMAQATKKSTELSEGMLTEMRDARDAESAPYIVAYIDIPYDKAGLLYFVLKNVGRSVAHDIRMEFDPPLVNTLKIGIDKMPMFTNGIGSLPPGHELKTFFDGGISYFAAGLPKYYKVRISYTGGMKSGRRTIDTQIDLGAFENLHYGVEKSFTNLVEQVEKVAEHSGKLSQQVERLENRLTRGIWLKHPHLLPGLERLSTQEWRQTTVTNLSQFLLLWPTLYKEGDRRYRDPLLIEAKNIFSLIGAQTLLLATSAPPETKPEEISSLVEVASALTELGNIPFHFDSYKELGNKLMEMIGAVINVMRESAPDKQVILGANSPPNNTDGDVTNISDHESALPSPEITSTE